MSKVSERTSYSDEPLVLDLVWNPRAKRGNGRGALVGTLLGVPVTGADCGRGTAFQFQLLTGEVRTVWWDGTVRIDRSPHLFDVDSGAEVNVNPLAMAWFARLSDVDGGAK
ncbi:hypothetical protein PBI_MEGABEAR_74 [Mycobacterium phage Megabear]|nr:hypothetical protein PBI_MEGABEAR_74 [Mycobacterium phage Megabear]